MAEQEIVLPQYNTMNEFLLTSRPLIRWYCGTRSFNVGTMQF